MTIKRLDEERGGATMRIVASNEGILNRVDVVLQPTKLATVNGIVKAVS
jgi:hypothetical protein